MQSVLWEILLIFPRFLGVTLSGTFKKLEIKLEVIGHIICWLLQYMCDASHSVCSLGIPHYLKHHVNFVECRVSGNDGSDCIAVSSSLPLL